MITAVVAIWTMPVMRFSPILLGSQPVHLVMLCGCRAAPCSGIWQYIAGVCAWWLSACNCTLCNHVGEEYGLKLSSCGLGLALFAASGSDEGVQRSLVVDVVICDGILCALNVSTLLPGMHRTAVCSKYTMPSMQQ